MNSFESQDLETSIAYAQNMKCSSNDNLENLISDVRWNTDDLEMMFLKEIHKNVLNTK